MWPLENKSNPPSTYTTLWPGLGVGPSNNGTKVPFSSTPSCSRFASTPTPSQNHTLAPGALAVSSVAYMRILSVMAPPSALRSLSLPWPSSPESVFRRDLMKWVRVHSSMRPTRSVVEMEGVRLTTLKRPACLTKR